MIVEDRFDRVAGQVVTEMLQRAADPRVAPRRILVRHADHERSEVWLRARSTRAARTRSIVLLGDEQAVPAQDRIGRDDAGDVGEAPSADGVAFDGQAASLVIGEVNPAGTVRRAEDPVLLGSPSKPGS